MNNNDSAAAAGGAGMGSIKSSSTTQTVYMGSVYAAESFVPLDLANALKMPLFNTANSYMLNGDYKSYISRSLQPIISVSSYQNLSTTAFKIIYEGSGGGILMCIINIS